MTRTAARLTLIVVALIVGLAGPMFGQAGSSSDHWVATWGAAQTMARTTPPVAPGTGRAGPPAAAPPAAPPPAAATASAAPAGPTPAPASAPAFPGRRFPVPPTLASVINQTVRMIVRSSVGGRQVRVRLSNAFNGGTVTIGAASLAKSRGGAAIDPASRHALTFSGKPSASLYAGQVLISDPVDLVVAPLTDLAVSVFVPGEVLSPTNHLFALRTTYVAAGDATAAADVADPVRTTESYYWLAGVDVLAAARTQTIVTFGDSITDGDQSTPNKLAPWPTRLAARLQGNRATAHLGVVNAGISGNRILGDNGGGLARLMYDALSQPGVSWIVLLEGINDISGAMRQPNPAAPFTEETLIAACRQVIAQAHLRGVRVAGATLTPFGGSSAYSEGGERIRSALNDWIRTSKEFDAVVDFDRAVRDPKDPQRFRPEADSPDLLHPGDAGYAMMADAIDLSIFTKLPAQR